MALTFWALPTPQKNFGRQIGSGIVYVHQFAIAMIPKIVVSSFRIRIGGEMQKVCEIKVKTLYLFERSHRIS